MKQGVVPTEEQLANDEFKKYLSADNKYRHGSVIRFALFLGKSKVVLNRPSDNIDESQMKQYLLSNEKTSSMARLTMRISDYDGTWTNQYDSVYVGRLTWTTGASI
jgi:aspartate-semialdehyde dehydrogenase